MPAGDANEPPAIGGGHRAVPAPTSRDVGWPAGWYVEHVLSTGSTNNDLLSAAGGRPDRSVLVADHQTAGKGRLDRRWDAPPGANLLASMLFHIVPADPGELARRVSLAAVNACREVAGADVVLKWPNDLLVGDAKLAGILAERGPTGAVVVGIGLNVGWAPEGAARLGDQVDRLDLLRALLIAYDALPADVASVYRAGLATLGRAVRVERPDGVLEGRAVDVEVDGRLVVIDTCGVSHRLAVGDVVHVRTV